MWMAVRASSMKSVQDSLPLPGNGTNVASFYGSTEFSDATLVIGDGAGHQEIPVHKLALSSASPVMAAMLKSSSCMQEAATNRIAVKDADPVVVELLLRHMYGISVKVPVLLSVSLWKLADQYQVYSATSGLEKIITQTSFTLDAIKYLLPLAAHLGTAARDFRTALARQAAAYATDIVKEPQVVHHWDILEMEVLMSSPGVLAYQALVLAAAWASAEPSRIGIWPRLQDGLKFQSITYAQLQQLGQQQELLSLPGLSAALFGECLRRMDKVVGADARGNVTFDL